MDELPLSPDVQPASVVIWVTEFARLKGSVSTMAVRLLGVIGCWLVVVPSVIAAPQQGQTTAMPLDHSVPNQISHLLSHRWRLHQVGMGTQERSSSFHINKLANISRWLAVDLSISRFSCAPGFRIPVMTPA
jgi:hypothetical protein